MPRMSELIVSDSLLPPMVNHRRPAVRDLLSDHYSTNIIDIRGLSPSQFSAVVCVVPRLITKDLRPIDQLL